MEKVRYNRFLKAVLPVLQRLNEEWFPADKRTPDGESFYACTYCDMECGHERHDDDCFSDLAKRVLQELERIDADPKFDSSPYTNVARTPEDAADLREWFKVRFIIKKFYGTAMLSLIPMDYSLPENRNVLCTCRLFGGRELKRRHKDDCVIQAFAKALAALLTVTDPLDELTEDS